MFVVKIIQLIVFSNRDVKLRRYHKHSEKKKYRQTLHSFSPSNNCSFINSTIKKTSPHCFTKRESFQLLPFQDSLLENQDSNNLHNMKFVCFKITSGITDTIMKWSTFSFMHQIGITKDLKNDNGDLIQHNSTLYEIMIIDIVRFLLVLVL